MSSSVPKLKLACQKRLRSCDSSKRNIQNDDEGKGEKMQNDDGKVKNLKTSPVVLGKEKEKEKEKGKNRLNNNSNRKNKTRTDDNKKGEKKIYTEVKNGKASPTSCKKEKRKEEPKASCSRNNMQTVKDVKEEETEIWNDQRKLKRRKFSTMSYERGEGKTRSSNGKCGEKIHDNFDDREDQYMLNCDSKVKDDQVTVTSSEKEKKRKRDTNTKGGTKWLQSDVETGEKQMQKLGCKISNGASAVFFEKGKERKRVNSTICEKKRDDKKYEKNVENGYSKVKSKKVPVASYVKEEKKKMPSHDSAEKKINGAHSNISLSFSKNRTEPITSVVNKKKMRPYKNTEMKMQHDVKQKKRIVPSDMSKMKKTKAPVNCNYEKRKREELTTSFKEVKRMQSDYNKKNHIGEVKEKNCGVGEKKKRNTPLSFFKVVFNNFKEYLYIPPKVAPELEDLINHRVYLEDSEGEISKIRLSVVDGFLAFHQGWNIFVSDHLIKRGDFLLFEYTAKSTFFVRIFGSDSRERLHFDVGKKREGVRKKGMHTKRSHHDLILFDVKSEDCKDDYYFSDKYPRDKETGTHYVTVHTSDDPNRFERMVESGPVPLDNKNGNEVIRQWRTKGLSPQRSKGNRVILSTGSGSSVHENDIVKLIASTADSDTHHMAADTNKDPKWVQSDVGNGQSAVVGVAEGRLTDVECRTKCTSLKCSEKKGASSVQIGIENGPSAVEEDGKGSLPDVECVTKCASPNCSGKKALSVDEAPLAHEYDDTLKDNLNLHDSDENLRSKQEISSSNLQYTTAVNKYNSDGEMKFSPNVSRNYEAPGGFRCLEKWKNSIVRDWAVLDGTGLIKPESTQETDRSFVVEYGVVGLNPGDKCMLSKDTRDCSEQIFTMVIKDPAHPDIVSTCRHDTTEGNHSIDGKGQNPVSSEGTCAFIKNHSNPDRISRCGDSRIEINNDIDEKGTIVKLETNMEHLEPLGSIVGTQTANIPVCANNGAACQPEHCFFKQEDTNCIDLSTPAKPEILKSDDRAVVNMQFCIPNTTRKWLELPRSLSNAVRQRKLDRNVVMLKDPMKRLWPVLYHDNSIFLGFTAGWKPFCAANNLQIGDLCELFKEPGEEDQVYSVQITKK